MLEYSEDEISKKERESEDENKKAKVVEEFLKVKTKRGKWEEVVEKYKENPNLAQRLKLTVHGDTALHLAVIDDKEETVETLVHHIGENEEKKKQLLKSSINESGNNPLHLAAVMGSVRMCNAIASANEELVGMRNKLGETPLFLAAVYGNKDAFYCLYYFCRNDTDRIAHNCRVVDKKERVIDTVLHRALNNEQFDLAFQLIHNNNDCMNWVNNKGLTPLHVLASKPTSFKSGSHIKGWRNIVYYCTFVNELKPQTIETIYQQLIPSMPKAKTTTPFSNFPINYHTCIHFFTILKHLFLIVSGAKEKKNDDEVKKDKDLEKDDEEERGRDEAGSTKMPTNYSSCMEIFQFGLSAIMIILGLGCSEIRKVKKKKEKHRWAIQVMEKLIESASPEKHENDASTPKDVKPTGTAMLTAAKHGAIDIVRALFHHFPLSIRETQDDKKNVVLLAAQFRQPEVYRFLLKNKNIIQNLFEAVDHNGNSALHLAATALDPKLWLITGAAFQMQWEVKWYKYVKESVPVHVFRLYNKKGETASEIFHESHIDLVAKGGDWLYKTSESCSLVATLIATVAFATATTVPGGNDDKGEAKLKTEQGFFIFSISSLIALCLSSTSMIMFLAILTSRFHPKDFGSVLPWKLLIGLSCLYFSIIAMLISFCSGHYFLIIPRLHNNAVLLYTLIFLPVALIFGVVQLPLYFDLLQAILKRVPKRSAAVVCS